MKTYSDEQLEYYADRFIRLRLYWQGWSLPQYLACPELGEQHALEPEPLLPKQHAAALRLWQQQDTGLGAPATGTPHDHIVPCWKELMEQMQREIEGEEAAIAELPRCNNGAPIEPMRHHRFKQKRNRSAFFQKRGA